MATLRQVFPSKYLKASDLEGVDQFPATVKMAALENVQAPGEAPQQKVVLYFLGSLKPFIVNSTNFKAMIEITGQEDSDYWNNTKVLLVTDTASFAGKSYDVIRIKAPRPVKNEAEIKATMAEVEVEAPFS